MSEATAVDLDKYGEFLVSKKLSKLTYEHYLRDAKLFLNFLNGKEISIDVLKDFREQQLKKYNEVTVKALISGVNKYLEYIGSSCKIEQIKVSRKKDGSEKVINKDEYARILKSVKASGDDRLYLIVESICSTGLKFSELKYLTVEAVIKGKVVLPQKRNVYLSKKLCGDMLDYCRNNNIFAGTILLTREGNLPDRSNISRAIKQACKGTGIDNEKLSTKALRGYFLVAFENFRSEMVDLMDEEHFEIRAAL